MSSFPTNETDRLGALVQENLQLEDVSEAEERLLRLQASINQGLAPSHLSASGLVAEDFVQLSVLGYSGNDSAGEPRGIKLASPRP